MTDKELLEYAAKAAGLEGAVTEYENGYVEMVLTNHFMPSGSNIWNPLYVYGDALWLAVKLKMSCDFGMDTMSTAYVPEAVQGYACDHENDPYKASCRAIVAAAAESVISKIGMEEVNYGS